MFPCLFSKSGIFHQSRACRFLAAVQNNLMNCHMDEDLTNRIWAGLPERMHGGGDASGADNWNSVQVNNGQGIMLKYISSIQVAICGGK